jgi:hypothetical protein
MLIQCQSYCGDYVCSFGDVAVTGGDGTGSSTQVPVVRRAWAPAAMSYHARHLMSLLPEAPTLVAPTWYREALG